MWMAWGPELTFFCNAAYRRDTLGRKYPWALGRPAREVWAEIWDDIGPRIDRVLDTGEATWDEGLLLFLERSGYTEESYHTFSYSPLRGDDGAVVGMLCVVSEDTERVIGERRMATLRDLGSDPSVIRTEHEVLEFAGRQLAGNAQDLPFTLTYLLQDDETAQLAGVTGLPEGHALAVPLLRTDDPDPVWPVAALTRGETVLVDLTGPSYGDLPCGVWPAPPEKALVAPLLRQGNTPYGFLVAGLNRYRALDDGYRGFIELTAGHLASGVGSARSYETQEQRAEELAELDRAKTTFFSNISHEFRTPLTLIMGPLAELRTRLAQDTWADGELDMIHRNGLRLSKLVNTLLDFSRIEAGRMQARYEPTDLAALTAELASVFRSAMEKAGLDFRVDCRALTRPVHIDRGMWEKVVLNLLSNALKFTFEGSVAVTVSEEGGEAVVVIADSGVGVPAAELPRLFERFHRVENARSRSNEGSGIGLALVQELVGLLGGGITAQSAEGEGTCFTIRLPFGTAHLPADALVTDDDVAASVDVRSADPYVQEALRWLPNDAVGQQGRGPADILMDVPDPGRSDGTVAGARVLVVDDNADLRDYLQRLLVGAGYRVDTVKDGQEALDAIRKTPPDLLVSDVMMPRLDGLQLVAALRSDSRTTSLPVLLLSARAGQEASIEGLQAGADDYLVKPFTAADLLARVEANLKLSRLRTHHVRWRSALVDSLQEAFFVCDEHGAVVEINTAFTDILGYGPDSLPYEPVHPWWPDEETDPQAHRQARAAVSRLMDRSQGSCTVPVTHRDGHRLWITASFARAQDPDSGQHVTVGTFRDVTAEHYAVQRESALASLSTRLSQAVSLPDALSGALEELRSLWRARCVLAAVFDGGTQPTVTATDGSEWADLTAARREAISGMRLRPGLTTVSHPSGAAIGVEHPAGPMVLSIDLGEHRPFTEEDQLLLSLLAGHLAQGLTRAHQIDQQRETAITLQRAILGPSQLADGFAVRYEPATPPLEVGGDWYDTVDLPDGRIGIVVGDCVGHGLEAAAVMGQLRSACRALLLQDTSPARVLMALDHFAATVPGAMGTTVFCGVLNPGSGYLTYSSAGHPPGILGHRDGTTGLLEEGRSLPLAVRPGTERPEAECALPARSTLLLYTDGLVERRRRPLGAGIEEAGEAVRAGRDTAVDGLATDIMTRLAPPDGYDDDVALLLYRHPGPLDLSFPALSAQLAPVRQALRRWLDQCGLPPRIAQNVLVAAGEACANAIEHGHRDAPGAPVRLRAEALADEVRLTVVDSGRWKRPQPELNPLRGRGVMLMRALMHQVTITPGSGGTTVEMQTRIA
ncbi:SpoIIE family protein phosphatase [Streptomyces aquilus]|uniref:SpoIIE family protein phosphatase n=1 Tax=Streptomyces aquilus TaxID=2548456 RepID=UPI00367FC03B